MGRAQLTIVLLTALTSTVAVLLATLMQRGNRSELRSEPASLRTQIQSEMISLRNRAHAHLLMIHEGVAKIEAIQG